VVAHVGNSYPQTVVSQVLNLGLQNFSKNPPMISKLTSVVGILGHLVTTHSKEVQHAFEQTLQVRNNCLVRLRCNGNLKLNFNFRICF